MHFLLPPWRRGAGKELMDRENVGNLWDKNQHIPRMFPMCSQYVVNKVPTSTFWQQFPHLLTSNSQYFN